MTGPAILAVLALAADGWTVHTPVQLTTELKAACERAASTQSPFCWDSALPGASTAKCFTNSRQTPK